MNGPSNSLEEQMFYSIVLGIVIVALGAGVVAYNFWHEGNEVLPSRRRHHTN